MLNIDDLCRQINTEEEALMILSCLGFNMEHWAFIKKVGSAKKILASDLVSPILLKKAGQIAEFKNQCVAIRQKLDEFYASDGFLLSILSYGQSKLFKINTAPLVFFARFKRELLQKNPSVSIVGARKASPEALNHTQKLAECLARQDINVVSGGASGIDTAAHLGASKAGGSTTLISGLRCNFSRHEMPFELSSIEHEKLLMIHPYGQFFPQKNYMFVTRNQFVAGFCDALVVVQGTQSSGTLHTVRYARALKIPIFAIPGNIDDALSFAPNFLLENGEAKALVDFEQFASSLVTNRTSMPKDKKIISGPSSKSELPPILALIKAHQNALTMGEIMALSGRTLGDLQNELLEHEMNGLIFKRGAQFVLSSN